MPRRRRYEAGAGEETSETVIQKIFDELPASGGEGRKQTAAMDDS
jgi:hypothetical protein